MIVITQLSPNRLPTTVEAGGIFKGLYRYRYGSYRIIYAIDRGSVVILILRIADRKDVYEDPIKEN